LAAGMVVKLKRTSGRSSGASGQVSATKGPGDTDDTAPHTAQGGDDDAAEQLMGGKPISGLAGLRPELPAVSAFAAAPSPGPSRSSSRPQSPQAQPNPLSSLLKKLSSMMPEHLPPLPRAPSGNSASRGAAAAAAGTGAGAAAVSGAVHAAAPRATWQVLGSRSNSGVLQQQPRGSVGLLATGAGVAQAGGASAGAAAGGLESIMPATFR
jgi:hypothetical protein